MCYQLCNISYANIMKVCNTAWLNKRKIANFGIRKSLFRTVETHDNCVVLANVAVAFLATGFCLSVCFARAEGTSLLLFRLGLCSSMWLGPLSLVLRGRGRSCLGRCGEKRLENGVDVLFDGKVEGWDRCSPLYLFKYHFSCNGNDEKLSVVIMRQLVIW